MRPALHSTYQAPPAMNQPAEPLVRFTGVQKTYDGVQLVVRKWERKQRMPEAIVIEHPRLAGARHGRTAHRLPLRRTAC